ncbi:hypothetical protein [uncultured Metabacillus sp.]|uniref:hypothetical protein n=1 Tax=uncultured Metabacillus sp. TaxID=2860135 RepID=UPI002609E647|nr:hypothetical protein [uncultured Metabacillus sp.]
MKKLYLVLVLCIVFLVYSPQLGVAETNEVPPKAETSVKTPKASYQWDKVDEGLYHFIFTSDFSKLTENEKLNTFYEQLAKFKKEHSGETIVGYQATTNNTPSASINGFMVSTEKKAMNGAVLAAIITGIVTGLIGLITLIYTVRNNKKTLFVNNITSERVKWMGQLKEYVAEFISLASFYNEKPVLEDAKEKGEYLDKIIHARAKIKLHLNYKGEADKKIMEIVDKMSSNIMTAFETFTLLKKSDKEKVAYVMEQHKEQLDKRIKSKIDKSIQDTPKSQSIPDYQSVLKTVTEIVHEAQNEEIALFNNRFKKEFKQLKKELQNNTDILLEHTQKYLKEEWNRVKQEAEKGNLSK